jgi:ketosteroid isomerase-like protein
MRMRIRVFFILATAALFSGAASHAQPAPAAAEETSAQIRRLENEWIRSMRDLDFGALDRVLAPEFTYTVAVAGRPLSTIDRDAYLHRAKGYAVSASRFEENLVRAYGDVAVVSSRYVQTATLHGKDRSAEFLLTDTWVKRDGQWKAAARVSSRPEHPSHAAPPPPSPR